MSRPALEVADVLHAQGDTFVAQHPSRYRQCRGRGIQTHLGIAHRGTADER